MSNVAIIRPHTPASIGGTFTDVARVGTPDPKEVAFSDGSSTIDLDFGENVSIGAVYMKGEASLSPYTVTGGASGQSYTSVNLGTMNVAPKRTATSARQWFIKFVPQSLRYIRITRVSPGVVPIGIAFAGEVFEPQWNHEYGAGRYLTDLSTVSRNRAGGFGIEQGAIVPGWEFSLGDLSDEEVETLFDMLRKVGESRPILVAEDPQQSPDLDARLHYGLFQRLEKYERKSLGITRWSLKVEDWI